MMELTSNDLNIILRDAFPMIAPATLEAMLEVSDDEVSSRMLQ